MGLGGSGIVDLGLDHPTPPSFCVTPPGAERRQGCPAKSCPCTPLHGLSSKRHLESCHVQNTSQHLAPRPRVHCARTLNLLLHLPSCNHSSWSPLWRCSSSGHHLPRLLTQRDLLFTLTDLSPLSNNTSGGLCWLIRCKASHRWILMGPHTSPSNNSWAKNLKMFAKDVSGIAGSLAGDEGWKVPNKCIPGGHPGLTGSSRTVPGSSTASSSWRVPPSHSLWWQCTEKGTWQSQSTDKWKSSD